MSAKELQIAELRLPLTEQDELKIMKAAGGFVGEINRLRALLAEQLDKIARMESGKKRKYSAKVMTKRIHQVLLPYFDAIGVPDMDPDAFVFHTKNRGPFKAVNSTAVQRELKKEATEELGMTGDIGTHSCRKAYAFHVYLKTGMYVFVNCVARSITHLEFL